MGEVQEGGRVKLWFAKRVTGGLSFPSKMPGTAYGLSALACVAGAKLARVPGTVCSACYALKGGYARGTVLKAHAARLAGLSNPEWVRAMILLILHYHRKPRIKVDLGIVGVRRQRAGGDRHQWNESGFHRWHDSGDLQSVEHLAKVCEVARGTPSVRHWLPTQELGVVKAFVAGGGSIPRNLVVRVSSVMVDDQTRRAWPTTSSVFAASRPSDGYVCPAPFQGHRCQTCRACWNPEVAHVAYSLH